MSEQGLKGVQEDRGVGEWMGEERRERGDDDEDDDEDFKTKVHILILTLFSPKKAQSQKSSSPRSYRVEREWRLAIAWQTAAKTTTVDTYPPLLQSLQLQYSDRRVLHVRKTIINDDNRMPSNVCVYQLVIVQLALSRSHRRVPPPLFPSVVFQ